MAAMTSCANTPLFLISEPQSKILIKVQFSLISALAFLVNNEFLLLKIGLIVVNKVDILPSIILQEQNYEDNKQFIIS